MVGITRRLEKKRKLVESRLSMRGDLVESVLKSQEEGARKSLKKRRMFAEDVLK